MLEQQEQQTDISSTIQSLPEHVWDWLTSDAATLSITEINNRLGFKSERRRIIPSLILKLITQNLDPMDFINELSHELNIGFQAAKAISEEIESRILKPIESELRRDVGVDVKLIYFGKPSTQRAEPKIQVAAPLLSKAPEPAPTPLPTTVLPPPLAAEALAKEAPLPPKPVISGPTEWEKLRREIPPAPEIPISPFILHQENAPVSVASKTKAEPSLNIKVKDYYQTSEERKPQRPVAVQLEYAQNDKQQNLATAGEMKSTTQNLAANIQEQKTRVVHYNEMRTPLNNLGLPKAPSPMENRVDLRKFAKPEINTIDLRKKS